jgi:hypothetical protein
MTILALVAGASMAFASDLLGPIDHLQGKHVGDGEPITWNIEYLDEWGRTFVDAAGGHFYHDRCCGGFRTDDPSWVYPKEIWGQYPMYYIGTTMRYRITLTNNSPRSYVNIRVVAIQEYLTDDGTWGEWISPEAAKDWYVRELRGNQTMVFEGSLYIPWGAHGGLDQTHLQVQHWDHGNAKPGPGSVIIDDAHAAIWCPPELSALKDSGGQSSGGQSSGGSQSPGPSASGSAAISAGERGFVEPGRVPAVVTVTPAGAGNVRVRIVSQKGAVVLDVTKAVTGTTPVVVTWDGSGASGGPADRGIYLVTVAGPGVRTTTRIAVLR